MEFCLQCLVANGCFVIHGPSLQYREGLEATKGPLSSDINGILAKLNEFLLLWKLFMSFPSKKSTSNGAFAVYVVPKYSESRARGL